MHNSLRHTYGHISSTIEKLFEDDILERKRYANLLTSIASNYSNGFVMAINDAWRYRPRYVSDFDYHANTCELPYIIDEPNLDELMNLLQKDLD